MESGRSLTQGLGVLRQGASIVFLAMSVFIMAECRQEHRDITAAELERSGGHIPTYHPTAKIDTGQLSTDQRSQLERLVMDSNFFGQPAHMAGAARPDAFEYRLTVRTGSGDHTVTYHDDDGHPESLDALADWIRTHAGSMPH